MTPFELTTFITAVANATAQGKSADEIALLSSMLMQLGDTLATIALLAGQGDSPEQKGKSPDVQV